MVIAVWHLAISSRHICRLAIEMMSSDRCISCFGFLCRSTFADRKNLCRVTLNESEDSAMQRRVKRGVRRRKRVETKGSSGTLRERESLTSLMQNSILSKLLSRTERYG